VDLPPGYVTRAVVGPEDAAALAAVHSGSFGSDWTAEKYAWLMTTPGYDPARELVVVAPDGSFAAFTVTWFDHVNGTGYFEPVGTHADHRRLGLGRALLNAGMQRMAKAGLTTALVMHEADNEGSMRLYADAGFRPIERIDVWTRPGRSR
jgi:ribosomal protein S18 acetylase RimI-like enzyme